MDPKIQRTAAGVDNAQVVLLLGQRVVSKPVHGRVCTVQGAGRVFLASDVV